MTAIDVLTISGHKHVQFQCAYCGARLDSADDIPRHEVVCADKGLAVIHQTYEWCRFVRRWEAR